MLPGRAEERMSVCCSCVRFDHARAVAGALGERGSQGDDAEGMWEGCRRHRACLPTKRSRLRARLVTLVVDEVHWGGAPQSEALDDEIIIYEMLTLRLTLRYEKGKKA